LYIGNQESTCQLGDLAELDYQFILNNKTPIVTNPKYKNEIGNDTISFSHTANLCVLQDAIKMMAEGDSCAFQFIGNTDFCSRLANNKIKFTEKDTVTMRVMLKQIHKKKNATPEKLEEESIARYINKNAKDWQALPTGLFVRTILTGGNEQLKGGQKIKMVYTGQFLNGEIFDNYAAINPFFEYEIGTQSQLIKGLELAVASMHLGDECEFILPSNLAFGTSGSSTGIVPPHRALLYKIKILLPSEG
jgi:FKBP-type peptidyl-prolyl cis-trans isomerase